MSRPPPMEPSVARRMSRQRRRDTGPELALRRELHRLGLRYRLHVPVPDMPRRTIDVAFRPHRLALFVDGCFWHKCPEHGTAPSSNGAWWQDKLEANRLRDRQTDAHLAERGWRVVRVWEHESPLVAARAVFDIVRSSEPPESVATSP